MMKMKMRLMMMRFWAPLLLGVGVLCNLAWAVPMAPSEPRQVNYKPFLITQRGPYTVMGRATFAMTGRVLSVRQYVGRDRDAQLSPIDFVMGWGAMSDQAVLSQIQIRHEVRHYFWHTDRAPIPLQQISRQSANMHLIPASGTVDKQLKGVRPGSVITLQGYLVSVTSKDGYHWNSSLTRTDSGEGSCEVVYVVGVKVLR